MKKVITLQNQHFLKKNYTYNFFRSSIRFNAFFLKNSFFLFKFYKIFKFFIFINFFLHKKIVFNNYKLSAVKLNKSIFLKKKNVQNNYKDLYGQNYTVFDKKCSINLLKTPTSSNIVVGSNVINYNYINIFNYNQFINLMLLNNINN